MQLAPIAHPTLDVFLLGFVAGCSCVAVAFFLRFWRDTRDWLFLAFALFFLLQAVMNALLLRLPHPNEGNLWLFLLRLISILVIVVAILRKNANRR